MARFERKPIGLVVGIVLALAIGLLVSTVAVAGSTAKVAKVKGTLVLDQEAGTGTATGTFKGSVAITHVTQDFTYGPRFIDQLVITQSDGSTIELTMDYLGTNFTTPALTGGGLAYTDSSEIGEPWYTLTVYMTPGVNYPEQVWSYEGVTGITE